MNRVSSWGYDDAGRPVTHFNGRKDMETTNYNPAGFVGHPTKVANHCPAHPSQKVSEGIQTGTIDALRENLRPHRYYDRNGKLSRLNGSGDYTAVDAGPPVRLPGHSKPIKRADRLVIDNKTGQIWYSPDHYGNFYPF